MGTRGLGIVSAFWASNAVKIAQEAGVVPRCRRAAIGTGRMDNQKTNQGARKLRAFTSIHLVLQAKIVLIGIVF